MQATKERHHRTSKPLAGGMPRPPVAAPRPGKRTPAAQRSKAGEQISWGLAPWPAPQALPGRPPGERSRKIAQAREPGRAKGREVGLKDGRDADCAAEPGAQRRAKSPLSVPAAEDQQGTGRSGKLRPDSQTGAFSWSHARVASSLLPLTTPPLPGLRRRESAARESDRPAALSSSARAVRTR